MTDETPQLDHTEAVFRVGERKVHATVGLPADRRQGQLPGLVAIEGSGPSSRHDQRGWVRRLARFGAAVLVHDKPGCGDTGGRWQQQTIEERADETLAAVAHLASHPGVDASRVGLWGASQGGWVLLDAIARSPDVAVAIAVSTPGVGPIEQERASLRQRMERAGAPRGEVDRAVASLGAMTDDLRAGQDPEEVVARYHHHWQEPWAGHIHPEFLDPGVAGFLARIGEFDPRPRLRQVRTALLAVWGGDDDLVPVERSRRIFQDALAQAPTRAFELQVFPGADHNLLVGPPSQDAGGDHPFAPGYLDAMATWFRRHTSARDDPSTQPFDLGDPR